MLRRKLSNLYKSFLDQQVSKSRLFWAGRRPLSKKISGTATNATAKNSSDQNTYALMPTRVSWYRVQVSPFQFPFTQKLPLSASSHP